jgi:hypothetical protein
MLKVGVAREERRLVSNLMAAISRSAVHPESITVISELDCFQGVADVVAGTFNIDGQRSNTSVIGGSHLTSFSTAKVLAALAGRRRSNVSNVVMTSQLSASTVRKELGLLQKMRMIQIGRDGNVSIPRAIRPPFKQIEAFEVKVKDWKSGIYQARNYKSFAHKVSVVLPLTRAQTLKNRLAVFRRMRVGLAGISPSGELKWLLKPRHHKPISSSRHFLATMRLLRNARLRRY